VIGALLYQLSSVDAKIVSLKPVLGQKGLYSIHFGYEELDGMYIQVPDK